MLKHVIDIGWTSVRLSVRLSHAGTVRIKTAEHIVMLSSPHDSPFFLVLCISRSLRNSDGVTPCGAAKQRWGAKISQFSTNNLLYLDQKRLKIDGYMLRGVWQTLNCLLIHVTFTFTTIVPGAYTGEAVNVQKMC